ncbi:FGGY-family carbohydrate kinase [Pelagibacterium sp. H642]|uniref:FGGY-family carbohydrate kinase n=1 Tax=Pelagibacterium sp. H642 TaxID=1881069 RepID=UPI0028159E97|nr:FGGY-family carbohydrate kinase [Pelagibacterium sp. H642]WMT91703.1 FGGY-family carbohydrate kinase [Pelagibacterium sp. H642]
MRHVGVIDIGKTNAKFAIVDAETMAEVAVRTRPNRVLSGPPYPHFDIEGIWDFLLGAMGELNREYPIDALSITTHGATAALVGGAGELVLPVLDYEFDGPATVRAEYDALCPPFEVTLTPRLAMGLNLGAQLYWLKREWPNQFARAWAILTYPQYWAYRLTGVAASELTSLGCHTGLWDFERGTFSSLVEALGIGGKLPPIRSAFDALGTIGSEVAERTGLAEGTPVHCGIHDSNASLLSHVLERTPPFSVVSTGTWVVVASPGGKIEMLDAERDCLANIDALGRTVPSARFMGGREYSLLTGDRTEPHDAGTVKTVLEKGLMLLPSVQVGSGPFPGREARWTGGAETADAPTRHAVISFYLALMTAECLTLTGAEGEIIVEGPFARNFDYLAMLEAATGRAVLADGRNATGTSIGAALLALGKAARPRGCYQRQEPDTAEAETLREYARRWRGLAEQ